MAKKPQTGAGKRKAPKPPKPPRPATRRRSAKEETAEFEEIAPDEDEIVDRPEGEDFDVDVNIEIDRDDTADSSRRRHRSARAEDIFGPDGVFGADGPFGPNGPFGAQGPFGPQGLFSPGGIFGNGAKRGRRGRTGPTRRAERAHRDAMELHGLRPQGRRKRMFGPGELRLVMLAMFAEEPRHGYEFIKAMEEMTDGAYSPSPGIVYPTIQMLSDEGMIEAEDSDDSRKLYRASDAGLAELDDRADELEELFMRLGRKAEKARSHGGSPEILRALGNLAAVVTNKAKSGGFGSMDADRIVDLIDELARKIERF